MLRIRASGCSWPTTCIQSRPELLRIGLSLSLHLNDECNGKACSGRSAVLEVQGFDRAIAATLRAASGRCEAMASKSTVSFIAGHEMVEAKPPPLRPLLIDRLNCTRTDDAHEQDDAPDFPQERGCH